MPSNNKPAIIGPREWLYRCVERAIETECKLFMAPYTDALKALDAGERSLPITEKPGPTFHELALSWAHEVGTSGLVVSRDLDLKTGRRCNQFLIADKLVLNERQWELCYKAGRELQNEGVRTASGRSVTLLLTARMASSTTHQKRQGDENGS
jgi:hypothetical protein